MSICIGSHSHNSGALTGATFIPYSEISLHATALLQTSRVPQISTTSTVCRPVKFNTTYSPFPAQQPESIGMDVHKKRASTGIAEGGRGARHKLCRLCQNTHSPDRHVRCSDARGRVPSSREARRDDIGTKTCSLEESAFSRPEREAKAWFGATFVWPSGSAFHARCIAGTSQNRIADPITIEGVSSAKATDESGLSRATCTRRIEEVDAHGSQGRRKNI